MAKFDFLKTNTDLFFIENKDLSGHSTMRLKARGHLLKVFSVPALQKVLPRLKQDRIPYRILGRGSNQLLPPRFSGVYITLEFPLNKADWRGQKDWAFPASVSLAALSAHAARHGLAGWEVFTGIPGSLGGAVAMNAGTGLGEIGSLVTGVDLVGPCGGLRHVETGEGSFGYRENHFVREGEVIVAVRLTHRGRDPRIRQKIRDYLRHRSATQPLKAATCGCVFKNHRSDRRSCKAGHSMDIMELKGLTLDKVGVSSLHANFLENREGATLKNVQFLIGFVQKELELQLGINFQTEVVIPDAE